MKCERLISLVKNWYMKVQEEAMAPARMVAFMEKHISQCEECLADPDVKLEVEKIREIVLPPSKIPKPKSDGPDDEERDDEEYEGDGENGEEDEEVDSDDDDLDEDMDDEEEEESDYDPDMMDDDDEI